MNVLRSVWLPVVLGCAAGWVGAQPDMVPATGSLAQAYQRIDLQRKSALEAFDAAEADCAHTFAVNACVSKVRSQRRSEEADWRRQEAVLHDLERRQRSEEALARLNAKAQDREQVLAASAQANRDAQQRQADLADKQAQHARQGAAQALPRSPSAPTGPSAAEQAQNRADYQRKLDAAEQRKQAMKQRVAEQAAKPVQPMPLPAPP